MRTIVFSMSASLLVSGCIGVVNPPGNVEPKILGSLREGMDKDRVYDLLKSQKVSRPSMLAGPQGYLDPMPCQDEVAQAHGKTIEIRHYRTRIHTPGPGIHAFTDGPTIPLVFARWKLAGWGEAALRQMLGP